MHRILVHLPSRLSKSAIRPQGALADVLPHFLNTGNSQVLVVPARFLISPFSTIQFHPGLAIIASCKGAQTL
jgi:hypothetical protein